LRPDEHEFHGKPHSCIAELRGARGNELSRDSFPPRPNLFRTFDHPAAADVPLAALSTRHADDAVKEERH
jgi:hypothetical protein